jgi:glutamyl/glutaminyl-tRNA synthetase
LCLIIFIFNEHLSKFANEFKGTISSNHQLDDQILLKSDGYPTYHLANIVDDYTMKISHVIRGNEWLPSTPKHLLLYHMLDITPPEYIHIPLIVNSKGAKLSKRHGDVSVDGYIQNGYLPESVANGLALLGWSPPMHSDMEVLSGSIKKFMESEVLNMADLEAYFDLSKIGKAPCRFDEEKFKYFNSQHIRRKFEYYNPNERKESTVRFRQIMLNVLTNPDIKGK